MDRNKIHQDLLNSISILDANISLFHAGTKEVYIVIANELRKLVCDKNNSLLPKVFSTILCYPIKYPDIKNKQGLILQTFGGMKLMVREITKSLIFSMSQNPNCF